MVHEFNDNHSELNDYEDDLDTIEGILHALILCIPFWVLLTILVAKFF